jgi:alkylation response protein AidB-like acyl-CoA dehydrogenase
MDFTFTQEQQMLLETTRRFIAKDYTFETRNRIRKDTPHAHSRETWQGLADLGLLSLNVPEADGGLGGGAKVWCWNPSCRARCWPPARWPCSAAQNSARQCCPRWPPAN